jgi:hypothetical protein
MDLETFHNEVAEALRALDASPFFRKYLEWEDYLKSVWIKEELNVDPTLLAYPAVKAVRQGKVLALLDLSNKRKELKNINRLKPITGGKDG